MKTKILFILFLFTLGYSQEPINSEMLVERDGVFLKPYSGPVFSLHEDGSKKSKGTYKNGLMNGRWEFYFSNGNMSGMGQYKDGKGTDGGDTGIPRHGRHGKWTFWYESGEVKEKQNWKNEKLDGLYTKWYENGQKKREGTFKDGKRVGLYTSWFENEQKSSERTYKDGKLDGLWTRWYENGQKKWEYTYKDGDVISSKKWNRDGSVKK